MKTCKYADNCLTCTRAVCIEDEKAAHSTLDNRFIMPVHITLAKPPVVQRMNPPSLESLFYTDTRKCGKVGCGRL